MNKYIKLPNGEIVRVDHHGRIAVKVDVDLSEIIDSDLEQLLDLLSERATGSGLMTDISYSVAGHQGDTLTLDVSGGIGMIEEVEDVDISVLPEIEFDVEVTRIGYGQRTERVKARTLEEAVDIADETAGNHLYSEHNSDYTFEARRVAG